MKCRLRRTSNPDLYPIQYTRGFLWSPYKVIDEEALGQGFSMEEVWCGPLGSAIIKMLKLEGTYVPIDKREEQ